MSNIGYPQSRIYSGHYFPVLIDFNFIVDSTNGNGLGLRSLKGAYVKNVFMHTTASFVGNTHTNFIIDGIAGGTGSLTVGMPLSGTGIAPGTTIASITSSSAITTSLSTTATNTAVTISYAAAGSPNPAVGYILAQMSSGYERLLFSNIGDGSPLSGTNIAIAAAGALLTVGQVYVITVLGTSLPADWLAIGLPLGVTPAVGASFVATSTGAGIGSGQVQVPLAAGSGIAKYDLIGDPNVSNSPMFQYSTAVKGAWVLFRALAATSAGVTTFAAAAPANGSLIAIQTWWSNSPLLLGGQ